MKSKPCPNVSVISGDSHIEGVLQEASPVDRRPHICGQGCGLGGQCAGVSANQNITGNTHTGHIRNSTMFLYGIFFASVSLMLL